MRKYLSSAFSLQSLVDQESIVQTIIDQFMTRVSEFAKTKQVWDAVQWFNMLTFDIIGDLAFGDTFHGIESGILHPWISRITGAMTQGALADCLRRFPILAIVVTKLFSGPISKAIADTKINEQMSIDLVARRATKQTSRKDFMTRILESKEKDGISEVQIAAHASDFVLAGSETTATALASIVYYCDRTPAVRRLLCTEIRSRFSKSQDITFASTQKLPYLTAVVSEAMRLYPPLPFALPRDIPQGGGTVDGYWLPEGVSPTKPYLAELTSMLEQTVVSTNPLAACLDPANFQEPLAFKPERWLANDRNEVSDVLDASQPFSLGPRGCLGQR